jgi:hypothetical protein
MAAESFRSGWSDYVNDAAVGNVSGLLARLITNAKMRHDGYGGMAGRFELLTAGVSSRPVRKIALITSPMLEAAPYRRR